MKFSIPLSEIPETGIEKSFDNQELWLEPIKEFKISCTILEPITAQLFLLKQGEGCLIRGSLSGKVELLCDRCKDKSVYEISSKFEEFEEHPEAVYTDDEGNEIPVNEDELVDASLIFLDKYSRAHVDLGSLLWEEFSLALPVKPVCKADCKGICVACGANKNVSECTCEKENTDPRFEKLKNLKIATK